MTYQLGVIPRFPARVVAGVGIRIDRANAVYTFSTDYSTVAPGSVTDPANTDVLVQLPDGTYATVPVSAIATSTLPIQQTGKRNALINGGFSVWQRGTTFAPTTVRMLTADRWAVKTAAGTLTTAARATALQPGLRGPYGIIIQGAVGVTTVDIDQRIEAINAAVLRAPPPFVTFSAKIINTSGSPVAPTLFVETPTVSDNWTASAVQNNGGAGDALQSCPNGVMTTVTWSADVGAYANLANGLGFRLRFPSGALDINTKAIEIHDVQVEVANAVNDPPSLFEVETFSDELARCQRYYQKTFQHNQVPASNAGNGLVFAQATALSQTGWYAWQLPVVMRGVPTVVLYNPGAAGTQMRNNSNSLDFTGTVASANDRAVLIQATAAAGTAAGQQAAIGITADAEL